MTRYAGDPHRALDWPATVMAESTTTISNISSTSWQTGGPQVDFVAPSSGRVLVTVSASLRDSSGNNLVFLSPRIINATGGTAPPYVDGPNQGRFACSNLLPSAGYSYVSRTVLFDRLEPGELYTALTRHKVNGGSSCDIDYRAVMVQPAM